MNFKNRCNPADIHSSRSKNFSRALSAAGNITRGAMASRDALARLNCRQNVPRGTFLEECNPALSPISGCGDSGTAEFELFHVEQFVREHQKAGPYTIRTMPESKRLNELRVRRKNVPRGTLWPRSSPIPPLKCGTLANVPCGAFVSSSIRCCRTFAKP